MASLDTIARALGDFQRSLGYSMPLHRLKLLLALKQRSRATLPELWRAISSTSALATIHDSLQKLAGPQKGGNPAPLVYATRSEDPGGTVRYSLTPRGHKIVDDLAAAAFGSSNE